jgi:protease IV
MKEFFKMLLAVICGLFITGFIIFFLFSSMITALSLSSSSQTALPKSGVLMMDMSQLSIVEQPAAVDPMSMLRGDNIQSLGLWQTVQAINAAAADPSVKYIYLKSDGLSGDYATIEELRKSLDKFRLSGKPVISHIESPTTGSYYLSSVSDKIYMTSNPGGNPTVLGVGSQLIFLKDILDRLGVNVQLIRHGKYKSAGEMYIRSESSKENLEQNQAMVDAIWKNISDGITGSREISSAQLDEALNDLKLNLPQNFLELGFVDELLTTDELRNKLADLAVVDDFEDLQFINLSDYITAKVLPDYKSKNKIAVIYADGEIVGGSDKAQVAGDRFATIISKVRKDDSIKAVVLRVNSPGGSVIAADKIKNELDLLKAEKPLVASYGGYAASGGYWISANCEHIFSDAGTLTGSIGVFSMIPEFSKTAKDIAHVNITTVKSHEHADMYTLMRPFDARELDVQQTLVDDIYSAFVSNVSQGRGLDPDYVDSIAQGRVWTGAEALEIGLVDEIGTLEDAIHYAAALVSDSGSASLDGWRIEELPRPVTQMEAILESFGTTNTEPDVFAGTAFEDVASAMQGFLRDSRSGNYVLARMPYAIELN